MTTGDDRDFQVGHFHNFWTCVTLTLDQVIWYTVVYHSSTSTYKLFVDGRMDRQTDTDTKWT